MPPNRTLPCDKCSVWNNPYGRGVKHARECFKGLGKGDFVVLKFGSNILAQPARKKTKDAPKQEARIAGENFEKIAKIVADLRTRGIGVLIVHSGALHAGAVEAERRAKDGNRSLQEHIILHREAQGLKAKGLPLGEKHKYAKKVLAEIGQRIVVDHFKRAFAKHSLVFDSSIVGDPNNLSEEGKRKEFSGKREYYEHLNKRRIIPGINGNDAQHHGYENDAIAAETARLLNAEALVLNTAGVKGIKTAVDRLPIQVVFGPNIPAIDEGGGPKGAAGGPRQKAEIAASHGGDRAVSVNSFEQLGAVLLGAHGEHYGTAFCPARRGVPNSTNPRK